MGYFKMWGILAAHERVGLQPDRNATFPLISWLKYQEVEDVKACLHSEPGGAATSTGRLELLGDVFVCHKWLDWGPPAMEWAKDTSVSRLQKNWPTVMTSSAQNINTSSGNHWIVINIKNESIGKDDSPHGIPTWRLFFFKDYSYLFFQVHTWLQLNKGNLKFHFLMFLSKCDF